MKENANYYYGWVDSGIPDILDILQDDLPRNSYMMITELDSTRELADGFVYKKLAKNAGLQVANISRAIYLPVQNILDLLDSFDNLFNGFDEVWFFSSLNLFVPPDPITIVAPSRLWTPDIDEIETNELWRKEAHCYRDVSPIIAWMRKSRCYLGLGDGEGLNYITDRKDLAQKIEGFVDQD